jgi:hypothetical protein
LGGLKASFALVIRLRRAEDKLAELIASRAERPPAPNVEPLVADLDARIEEAIREVGSATLSNCSGRARQEVRQLPGQFKAEADATEVRLYSEQGSIEAALARAIGADARNCGSGGLLPIRATLYSLRLR